MNQVAAINPGLAAAQAANAKKKAAKEASEKTKVESSTKVARHTMTIVERTNLGTMIEAEYLVSKLNDAEFAKMAGERMGRTVSPATVSSYREAYGLDAPEKMTLEQARGRIRVLEAKLAEYEPPTTS